MAANGISTLATKQLRQVAKLDLAQAKRKGQTITEGGGTWSTNGVDDDTKPYYKPNNTYDITSLPDIYNGNVAGADDNPNPDGLLPKRPWVAVGAIAAPTSIQESVDGGTLVDLQVWYDGADTNTYVPSATDEGQITQWTDKSNFAHNANPNGGSAKPTYENTVLQNGYGYLEFDANDCLTVNPFTQIVGQAGFTFFVVAKAPDTTGNKILTAGGTGGGDLTLKFVGSDIVASMTSNSITAIGAGDTNWHYYTYIFDGDQSSETEKLTLRKDGTQIAAGSSGIGATTNPGLEPIFYIGNNDNNNAGWSGFIGEVIMFNKTLTSTEYGNVENYLANKWGL